MASFHRGIDTFSLPTHLNLVDGNMYYNASTAQHEFHHELPRPSGSDSHPQETRKDSALAADEEEAEKGYWTGLPVAEPAVKVLSEMESFIEEQNRVFKQAEEHLASLLRKDVKKQNECQDRVEYMEYLPSSVYSPQKPRVKARGYGMPHFVRDLRRALAEETRESSSSTCFVKSGHSLQNKVQDPARDHGTSESSSQACIHSRHSAYLTLCATRLQQRPDLLAQLVTNTASVKRIARTRNMSATKRLMLLERLDLERKIACNPRSTLLEERLDKLETDLATFRARRTTFYDLPVEIRIRINQEVELLTGSPADRAVVIEGKRRSWNEKLWAAFGWQWQK